MMFQKSTFKTNEDELKDLEAISAEDIERCLQYLQNFPEANAEKAWEFLFGLVAERRPNFDHHLENQHPLVVVFCKTLVALASVDSYFLIDLDEYLPEAPKSTAPAELSGPQDLDANHPAIVGLQKLYAHSHQLPDNVVHALNQLADAVEQDSAILDKFLATTTDEVVQAQADGGFSATEAQEILDNNIGVEDGPVAEGIVEEPVKAGLEESTETQAAENIAEHRAESPEPKNPAKKSGRSKTGK